MRMIKGAHRSIIKLKNIRGEVFEEAYFILKEGKENEKSRDVVREAKKIITENLIVPERALAYKNKRRKRLVFKILIFLLGVLLGAILGGMF